MESRTEKSSMQLTDFLEAPMLRLLSLLSELVSGGAHITLVYMWMYQLKSEWKNGAVVEGCFPPISCLVWAGMGWCWGRPESQPHCLQLICQTRKSWTSHWGRFWHQESSAILFLALSLSFCFIILIYFSFKYGLECFHYYILPYLCSRTCRKSHSGCKD